MNELRLRPGQRFRLDGGTIAVVDKVDGRRRLVIWRAVGSSVQRESHLDAFRRRVVETLEAK